MKPLREANESVGFPTLCDGALVVIGGRSMSQAAKATEGRSAQLSRAADSDVLQFPSRTLRSNFLDAEPQGVLEKLQSLHIALEQQENTLSDWPDSPSKERICAALAKARNAVSQIVEDLGTAAQMPSDSRAAKPT
jgi:hypothetical protein